jgi:dissimilatory sulfite reductase (desulfoviridin) alpha/beta subunit
MPLINGLDKANFQISEERKVVSNGSTLALTGQCVHWRLCTNGGCDALLLDRRLHVHVSDTIR